MLCSLVFDFWYSSEWAHLSCLCLFCLFKVYTKCRLGTVDVFVRPSSFIFMSMETLWCRSWSTSQQLPEKIISTPKPLFPKYSDCRMTSGRASTATLPTCPLHNPHQAQPGLRPQPMNKNVSLSRSNSQVNGHFHTGTASTISIDSNLPIDSGIGSFTLANRKTLLREGAMLDTRRPCEFFIPQSWGWLSLPHSMISHGCTTFRRCLYFECFFAFLLKFNSLFLVSGSPTNFALFASVHLSSKRSAALLSNV